MKLNKYTIDDYIKEKGLNTEKEHTQVSEMAMLSLAMFGLALYAFAVHVVLSESNYNVFIIITFAAFFIISSSFSKDILGKNVEVEIDDSMRYEYVDGFQKFVEKNKKLNEYKKGVDIK